MADSDVKAPKYDVSVAALRPFLEGIGENKIAPPLRLTDRAYCPVAAMLRHQGAPSPLVSRDFWKPDDFLGPGWNKIHEKAMVRFIEKVDNSGFSWDTITGNQALNLLDQAVAAVQREDEHGS